MRIHTSKILSLISAAAVLGSGAAAEAADLPFYSKAPPPVAAVYNWTGFYLGANAGGDWTQSNPKTTTVLDPNNGFLGAADITSVARVGAQRINSSGFTGGLAMGDLRAKFNYTDTFGDTEAAAISTTKTGWTAGAGGEYALLNGWSVKAEYLYVDLGKASTTVSTAFLGFPQVFNHATDLRSNIARFGMNYKFNGI